MLRTDFEDIIISQTPYYEGLDKTYRGYPLTGKYYSVLAKIARGDKLLAPFEQKKGRELVILGRKIFALQEEFVTSYFTFLKDESHSNQWEQFFERYSKSLFEIYERFTAGDAFKIIIFEIVNRKLLRDILTRDTCSLLQDSKIAVIERFSIVVNQLFNYIRKSLARNIAVPDSLITDSYEKIPLLPRCSRSELVRMLSKYLVQQGLPESIFNALFKTATTSFYTGQLKQLIEELQQRETINQEIIKEVFNSQYFFPGDKEADEVLEIIRERARGVAQKTRDKKLAIENNVGEINARLARITTGAAQELVKSVTDFSTEEKFDDQLHKIRRELLNLGFNLKKFQQELQSLQSNENDLDAIAKLKAVDLAKYIQKNDWDPFIIIVLNPPAPLDDDSMQQLIKDNMAEIKADKTATTLLNNLKVAGFLKEKYNTAEINNRFGAILEKVIRPLVQSLLLEELLDYYPKISGVIAPENLRYIAEEAMQGKVSLVEKTVTETRKPEARPAFNILRFKELVSVLCYDIRGSTFMGTKLQDAKKENEIRNLFQDSMLAIVEKHGGVPIKDTGDGGIALFAANNYDIVNGKTTALEPGNAVAILRCAVEMKQGATRFIEENIGRYQDWFKTAEERKIDFEGTTYATLPPAYQAIFQIGVGVASGAYPKEMFLDRNAFGELDLTGMLVREANFYSKVKAKDKSTVICDDSTIYNLLLNVNKFSFLGDTAIKMDLVKLDIEQGLEYWINQRVSRKGFIFDLYRIYATNLGQEVVQPGSLRILLGIDDLIIDETGEIKDGKGGRGKFLFEIAREAQR